MTFKSIFRGGVIILAFGQSERGETVEIKSDLIWIEIRYAYSGRIVHDFLGAV